MAFDPGAHQGPKMDWRKLFHQGRFAGYDKSSASVTLYSSGGRHWSTKALPNDVAVPELGVQDAVGHRVFHGDVVELVCDGAKQPEHYLCVMEDGQVTIVDHHGRQPSISVSISDGRTVGSIYGDIGLAKKFDSASRKLEMDGQFATGEAFACAASALTFMCLAGTIQYVVLQTVGLILCSLAAFGGVMAYCLIKRRGHRQWLMRSRVLRMAPIVGWVMAFAVAIVYATLDTLGVPGLSDPNQSSIIPTVCAGIFGGILGVAATVVGGDLSAHITGGHSTDPFGGPKGTSY